MDAKQRKTLMIRIGAGVVIALLLAFAGFFFLWPDSDTGQKQKQLSPSDPMAPAQIKPVDGEAVPGEKPGTLTTNPSSVQFPQDAPEQSRTVIITLTANGGPVMIQGAVIPTNDNDTLKVANIDCPVGSQGPLPANQTCTASVTWNAARTVNSTLTIATGAAPPTTAPTPAVTAAPGAAAGADTTTLTTTNPGLLVTLPITGVSTKPAGPDANGQPIPAPEQGAQGPSQAAVGQSPIQAAREAYLAARRGQGFNISTSPGGLQAVARSPYTSWDNIGVTGYKSSFPTDMTRVITPDKPLTAVLAYQIDTRQAITAVATIDRDIYGSSGRTVVIPRGTKLIGTVGGGATDRVGIAWRQLIRPDGVRFVFEGMSGDAMGRGGVPGRINNRYLQRYGYSLLPTLASAGLTAALGGQSSTVSNGGGTSQTQDARAVAAQILQQPLNQVAQDIYAKNSSIPVQITIPAGTRITVWSTGDLRLKPLGDPDDDRAQQESARANQGNAANQQRQNGQGFNPYAQQAGSGSSAPQPSAAAQQAPAAQEGNGSSLQVGRVDANGNYIAPGTSAPPPGPLATNTNNAAARVQGQQTTTTTQGRTNFPANSNPWQ